jgi:myosin heavy subunit
MNAITKTVKELLSSFTGNAVVTTETVLTAEQVAEINTALQNDGATLQALTDQVTQLTADLITQKDLVVTHSASLTALQTEKDALQTQLTAQLGIVATQLTELTQLRAWKTQQSPNLLSGGDAIPPENIFIPAYQAHANSTYARLHGSK